MKRPFVSLSIDRLEVMTVEYVNEQLTLQRILEEVQQRSSRRARQLASRLALQLSGTIPTSRLAPSLLGKRLQQTEPRPQPSPAPATPEAHAGKTATQLYERQRELRAQVPNLQQQLEKAEASQAEQATSLAVLHKELSDFIEKLVPGYAAKESQLNNRLGAVRQIEMDRLGFEAVKRWPSSDQLDQRTAKLHIQAELAETLRVALSSAIKELSELSSFVERNRLGLEAEAENELIQYVAAQLDRGEDEFDILEAIRERGHRDALTILARSRMYLENVLRPSVRATR